MSNRYSPITFKDRIAATIFDLGGQASSKDIRKMHKELNGTQVAGVLSGLKKEGILESGGFGTWRMRLEDGRVKSYVQQAIERVSMFQEKPDQSNARQYKILTPPLITRKDPPQESRPVVENEWKDRYDALLKEYMELAKLAVGGRNE